MLRSLVLIVALLALRPMGVSATPLISPEGFDSCDPTLWTATSGWSVGTARTGRCGAKLTLSTGAAYAMSRTFAASQSVQGRVYVTWDGTGMGGQRSLIGFGDATNPGCLAQLDATSGELVLRYGALTELGRYPLAATVTTAVGVSQVDGSGASCASGCLVACALVVDGVQKITGNYATIATYTVPTRAFLGSRTTNPGSYRATFDDWVPADDDVSTPIGPGYVVALYPIAPDQTNKDFQDGGSGAGNGAACANGTRYGCIDDLAGGTDVPDGNVSYVTSTTNGHTSDWLLSALPTQVAGQTIAGAGIVGDAENTGTGRPATLGITRNAGTNLTTSSSVTPSTEGYTSWGVTLAATRPEGGAWQWADFNGATAKLRAVNSSGNGNNRITAVWAVVDVRAPAPPEPQSLQDFNGDGGFCGACLGDSTTLGTGFGTCELDPSAGYIYPDLAGGTPLPGQCTQNQDCFACSTSKTTPCQADGDCPGGENCKNWGPCSSTGRWCTVLSAALTQTVGTRPTTWVNAGIGGNTVYALQQRVGTLQSGVGGPTNRHCRQNGNVACTPDNTTGANKCTGGSNTGGTCSSGADSACPGGICSKPCGTGSLCQSADCGTDKAAQCANDANFVSGTRVCSGSHATACTVDANCTGLGTCSDYPGADMVFVAIGGNDLRVAPTDADCNVGTSALIPPCPPQTTVAAGQPTPVTTPTPGIKACQRVSCTASSECAGGGAGLCSNNFTKGCDADADCTPGTCLTALGRNGSGSQCTTGSCSISTTIACGTDAVCPRGETCNTSAKFCSCPCPAVPCATDADCHTGDYPAFGGAENATWTARCVSGKCRGCGPPYSRRVCTGDHQSSCYKDSQCAGVGGTCTEDNPRYWEARRVVGASHWLTRMLDLKASIEATGAHMIPLTYFPANQDATMPDLSNWWEARSDLLLTRDLILGGALGENAVDLYGLLNRVDTKVTPKRCTAAPATSCVSNADCPLNVTGINSPCAVFRSVLRALEDPVHQNVVGAGYTGIFVATYTKQLSPVCSNDPTTGCGRCSGHCAGGSNANALCTVSSQCPSSSCDTTTACLTSATCGGFANSEKCLKTDSVCGGGNTCSRLRACWSTSDCTDHGLCTWDLATKCQSNADCSPASMKGICRPEGLPAVGAG